MDREVEDGRLLRPAVALPRDLEVVGSGKPARDASRGLRALATGQVENMEGE